ncbi:cation-translocating P-type ATPase [Oryzibacter oryziterrae]|uniref:cation-translocating P-type ATPase n=1 Tax=Oryzibacter oryziterrae TaxID=2766474 RepID=UPI001F3C842C|nr:cation-translocating P-type ATPase [Oryzibacter oryziterrae]
MTYMTLPPAAAEGLSDEEAARRSASEGFNELPRAKRRTPLRIVFEVLREPMLALLLGGGCVYLLLGDLTEALVLLAFATLSVAITVVQESRTERVLEALRDLTSPRAMVIRAGQRRRIAGRDVVRGDLVVLIEGDRVPADALLLECHDLQTDESLLTGESVPVTKLARGTGDSPSGHAAEDDAVVRVFSGTLVVRGTGLGEVTAIGAQSEIGKIGMSLQSLATESPRLQAQTGRLVRTFALIGGGITILAFVLYGTLRGGWLDGLLAAIALGMSMLPEEFPLVLAVFMAMGAWRISQARVLTRRAAAIETLGSATVLCTDKTGTLTENRMAIAELRLPDGRSTSANPNLAQAFRTLVDVGVLASAQMPTDPMEKAFHDLNGTQPPATVSTPRHLVHEYGLCPDLLAMTNVWAADDTGSSMLAAAKGAPEAIGRLCHLDEAALAALKVEADGMAAKGLRVLGLARAIASEPWPADQLGFAFEFLGLVGLADALRASVPAAVAQCRSAGISVVMITGDYPTTARAIATEAGIDCADVVTGIELGLMDDASLARRVRSATVFARIMPEQKLRIVEAFKTGGEVVAMTGDGVNDAPSLKAAHIGIAMGGRGSDVAREAASIVLLDDDFGSIVHAVRLGRRIYDNLVKAMGFILAVHVPIAGLALLPLVFGLPILFGPMHIAFLEMIIDPVCSLVFEAEAEEEDVMARPPRNPSEPLFSPALVVWGLLQGLMGFAVVAAIYLLSLRRGMPDDEVRAVTFVSLVFVIISLIFVGRSFSASVLTALRQPNRTLAVVLASVALMLAATLYWPFVRSLFRFGPLHAVDLAVAGGAGIALLLILEYLKPLVRARWQPSDRPVSSAP